MKLQEIRGLKIGLNSVKIKVISQDKTEEKVYELRVTKTDNFDSANTNLEILAIENYLLYPPFENGITQYTTQISNDTERLNIFAVPENEQGKVTISGNENLKEGNNLVTVTSTAPNGITKRDYKINAYKRNTGEEEQYKKQQDELKQKLEEAYEVEKTSTAQTNQRRNWYLLIGGVVIIVGIVAFFIYKKSENN